jgi:guanylate kinase
MEKGKLIIVSAPSGAGKTTLVHRLMEQGLNLSFSVSACSRPPRGAEVDGRDYYFIGVEGFRSKIEAGEFIEWEEVYEGSYYGTLRSEVERLRAEGRNVIFDLDVKGGVNIKDQFGEEALSVFIRPPSLDELETRLRLRSTDTEKSIQARLERSRYELSFEDRFDIVIVNDDLETASEELIVAVKAFLGKTGRK